MTEKRSNVELRLAARTRYALRHLGIVIATMLKDSQA